VAITKFFHDFNPAGGDVWTPETSSSFGRRVDGEHMIIGIAVKPAGSGSRPHQHTVEQFNYVLKGKLKVTVGGEEKIICPGELVHFPANVPHDTHALAGEDAVYITVKDKHTEYVAETQDGKYNGAFYVDGSRPRKE